MSEKEKFYRALKWVVYLFILFFISAFLFVFIGSIFH